MVNLFAVVPLLFNTFLLFALAVGFVIGIFAGGSWIVKKLKLFQQIRWQESLLTFGIGLVVFLLLMQILMGIQLFYSGVMWLVFAGLLGLAWRKRKGIQEMAEPLLGSLESWKTAKKESKV